MILLLFLILTFVSVSMLLYNIKYNIRSKHNNFFIAMLFIGSYGAAFSIIFKLIIMIM